MLIKGCWIWLLLCVCCAGAGCATGVALPPPALQLNHSGAEALRAGDLETAGARLNLALEYNPDFVDALVNLANVEIQRGNFERARQLLLRARRLNDDFAQAHHGLGVLAEREERLDDASTHYREALEVNPGFVEARANLARLLYEAGHYEHALVQFRRMRELVPASLAAHRGFVATLLSLQRLEEAEQALGAALDLGLADRQLQILAGRVSLLRGDLHEAKLLLSEAARVPDDTGALALAWLAVLELAAERPRHAIGAAQKALALQPTEPVATYALAVAATELDDPAAPQWLERALSQNPKNPVLRRLAEKSPRD